METDRSTYFQERYQANRSRTLAAQKRYRDSNKEKVAAKNKEYYWANRRKFFEYTLKNTYGITLEQFHSLLVAQDGRCAICNEPMEDPSVDHDHSCCPGKKSCGRCIRGLLDKNCNAALGLFNDSAIVVQKAVEYLHKAMGGKAD